MAALPEPMHSIENLIYAAYEAARDEEHRPHLGASIIGRPCERALWYGFRWSATKKIDGRILRLFETGQLAEPRFVANLRAIGAEVHELDPAGQQWRVSDIGGHFGGSMDGAAVNVPGFGKKWCVVEMKTHGEKSFTELKKKAVQVAKPDHYAQMQVYMGLTGMERALYLSVNKNTDELYSEKIHFDPVEFARLRARAERIITSAEPRARMSNDPSWYECKFCDYHAICHGETLPEVNCRTCAHSTPEMDGEGHWSCANKTSDDGMGLPPIPLEVQRKGCAGHRYIPILLQKIGTQSDFVDGDVIYKTDTGAEFAQGEGPGAISSIELRAMENKTALIGALAFKADLAKAGISSTVVA